MKIWSKLLANLRVPAKVKIKTIRLVTTNNCKCIKRLACNPIGFSAQGSCVYCVSTIVKYVQDAVCSVLKEKNPSNLA